MDNAMQMFQVIFATLIFGILTFVAWFRKKEYRMLLEAWASIYDKWLPSQKRLILSSTNAWIVRIVLTIMFLFALLALVRIYFT